MRSFNFHFNHFEEDKEYEEKGEEIEEKKEEVEKEEEEVEKEEEVDEEVEEVEEEERGEDSIPINVHHQKDGSQLLEPLGIEQCLRSDFTTQQEPVPNLALHTPVIEGGIDSCKISTSEETREAKDGKRTHIDADVQASGFEDGETNTGRIQPYGQELDAEISTDVPGKIGVQFTEGRHQEVMDKLKGTSPRLDVLKTRERSPSPGADTRGGSKRSAIRCEFFARGWCIKGNSCRFLHVKDHVTSQDKDGALDAAMIKSKLADGKGLEENDKRSVLEGSSDSVLSAVQSGENLKLRSDEELHACKDGPSSTPDVGRKGLGCRPYFAGYSTSSSPLLKDGSLHKNSIHGGKLSSVLFPDSYQNASGLDDMNYKRNPSVLDNQALGVLNDSSDRLPRHCSSSRNIDALDDQKLLDGSQEYSSSRSTSLQQKSLAFPSSETELSRFDLSRDRRRTSDHRTKASFDVWEPSVPFQPSFFLSQLIGCPKSLYDPIRDSIDQSDAGNGPSKFSFSGKGGPEFTKHVPANADPVSTGTLGPEQSSNKHSISGHIYHRDILPDNLSEKELSTNENEIDTADTAVAHQENLDTFSKEEKYSRSANLRKADKINSSTELPRSKLREKTQLEFERLRHGNEIDSDWKTDGSVNKESRVMKHFHAALVEFIKELLKPTWSEGLMSKDAYKIIVKKTVAKVINSLHPSQIPGTAESIKQYLSISQPKLAKLIEAYVEKHGKS